MRVIFEIDQSSTRDAERLLALLIGAQLDSIALATISSFI